VANGRNEHCGEQNECILGKYNPVKGGYEEHQLLDNDHYNKVISIARVLVYILLYIYNETYRERTDSIVTECTPVEVAHNNHKLMD
jgi:hypothetical protein